MDAFLLFLTTALIGSLLTMVGLGFGQALPSAQSPVSHTERPTPPTRDPNTPGYVTAKELPDGSIPPADVDGNFIIGPTHNAAPELSAQSDLANGTVIEFTMKFVGEQNLSGNCARRRHLRNQRSFRSCKADCDHKPPGSVYEDCGRLRPQAIRARQRGAIHSWSGRS